MLDEQRLLLTHSATAAPPRTDPADFLQIPVSPRRIETRSGRRGKLRCVARRDDERANDKPATQAEPAPCSTQAGSSLKAGSSIETAWQRTSSWRLSAAIRGPSLGRVSP
jgi:hypothetical protein